MAEEPKRGPPVVEIVLPTYITKPAEDEKFYPSEAKAVAEKVSKRGLRLRSGKGLCSALVYTHESGGTCSLFVQELEIRQAVWIFAGVWRPEVDLQIPRSYLHPGHIFPSVQSPKPRKPAYRPMQTIVVEVAVKTAAD